MRQSEQGESAVLMFMTGELNLDEFIQMMTIAKLGTPAGLGKDSKGALLRGQ